MQGNKAGICHGFAAIDPVIFGDSSEIKDGLSKFLQELRDSPKAEGQQRIYTHGEKEIEAVAEMMKNGIPVNENTLLEVLDMCEFLKMDFSAYFGEYRPKKNTEMYKGIF